MRNFKSDDELKAFIHDEVLTTSEAQEYLKVSRETLSSLVKRGKLIPVKKVGRVTLFWKDDLKQRKEESEQLRPKYRPYEE